MEAVSTFFKRKDVVISAHRYGIDAMGAMAQGLFASLLIGTIIKTLGQQLGLAFLVTAGGYAAAIAGPAMAASIGYALHAPQLVLFSLIAVGGAANELGGAGGPLAVYLIAIIATEVGKLVSKETKVDILVTPAVTILVGVGLSAFCAPSIGAVASAVGNVIMWATELQPLLMGIVVSVLVGVALTLPISSAAICAALGLTGLAGGAAVVGAAGFGIYELATRAILKDLLPEGTAIPATRGELALLLWQNAGRPEPTALPAFADTADTETAKAAQWCTEQGLLTAEDGAFHPEQKVTKYRVIRIWKQAAAPQQ